MHGLIFTCCARIELVFQLRDVGWRHEVSAEPRAEDRLPVWRAGAAQHSKGARARGSPAHKGEL